MDFYKDYVPNFKCTTDGNGKGIVNSKVGLITLDEVIHAGGYPNKDNLSYYLYNYNRRYYIWTMSPAGSASSNARVWYLLGNRSPSSQYVSTSCSLLPVINLNTGVLASGSGTSDDPYVVQTN